VNVSRWNAAITRPMNNSNGTIFATVVNALARAAVRKPLRIIQCNAHNTTDAPAIAALLLPSPNTGKK